jgi:hypothetical protein
MKRRIFLFFGGLLNPRKCLWLLLVLCAITANQLVAQIDGAGITRLPPLPGDTYAVGVSVNSIGEVAGASVGTNGRAVMWGADGTVTDLGLGPDTFAYSINDSGQVLAISFSSPGYVVWTPGSTVALPFYFTVFGDPSGPAGLFDTPNPHINNMGLVAGSLRPAPLCFLCNWDVAIYDTTTGSVTNLGSPGESGIPCGIDVNILGHVIASSFENSDSGDPGYGCYFYNGVSWTNIVPPPGFTPYWVFYVDALNDSDEVVGAISDTNMVVYAFSWTPSSGMTILGPGRAKGINNNGAIVGNYDNDSPFVNFSGYNVDLDTMVLGPVTNRPPSYTQFTNFVEVWGINDDGQVAGLGKVEAGQAGFLLPPLGASQYYPFLPSEESPHGGFWIFVIFWAGYFGNPELVEEWLWEDPPMASGFHYAIQSDVLFKEIANFPTGFSNLFTVSVNGTVLGQFGPGQSVVFSDYAAQLGSFLTNGTGVTQFDVTGIAPLVDSQNQQGFPLQLGFDQTNVVISMTMTPIGPPQLAIMAAGTNVVLTWPASAIDFTLNSTASLLPPAVWTAVSPGPVVVDGQNIVTNVISETQQFYRLSQ